MEGQTARRIAGRVSLATDLAFIVAGTAVVAMGLAYLLVSENDLSAVLAWSGFGLLHIGMVLALVGRRRGRPRYVSAVAATGIPLAVAWGIILVYGLIVWILVTVVHLD
jgi:hypothetical protein